MAEPMETIHGVTGVKRTAVHLPNVTFLCMEEGQPAAPTIIVMAFVDDSPTSIQAAGPDIEGAVAEAAKYFEEARASSSLEVYTPEYWTWRKRQTKLLKATHG